MTDAEIAERLRDYARAFDVREQDWPQLAHLLETAASRIEALRELVDQYEAPHGWSVLMQRDARRFMGDPFKGVFFTTAPEQLYTPPEGS